MKNIVLFATISLAFALPLRAGDGGATQWASKGDEAVPICKCTCFLKSEGGGDHKGFSTKFWFSATSDTKCDVNNGAECEGKDGELEFNGKAKDCNKAFLKKKK